jgi:hypothetical protein
MILNNSFNDSWNLWYHQNIDVWTLEGFDKIYEIINYNDFWNINNNIDEMFGGLFSVPYYILRKTIKPIWENNINGGEISIKINENDYKEFADYKNYVYDLWLKISGEILGEVFINNKYDNLINGVSINGACNNYTIIKIWIQFNNNDGDNDFTNEFLPNYILNKNNSVQYNSYESKLKRSKRIYAKKN